MQILALAIPATMQSAAKKKQSNGSSGAGM
jgi:hypothetical protein